MQADYDFEVAITMSPTPPHENILTSNPCAAMLEKVQWISKFRENQELWGKRKRVKFVFNSRHSKLSYIF